MDPLADESTERGRAGALPLVSIVIPCFNDEGFLGEAIESALAQTHAEVEVIVVDDGSTDGSGELARSFGSRVRVTRKPNGGLSSARNRGVDIARGDYVTFLDSDDILMPEFVAKTASLLDVKPTVGWVYVQLEYFGRETGLSDFPPFNIEQLVERNYLRATALIRTELCKRVRFDEKLRTGWEDWDFFLSLAQRGEIGLLLDEPLMFYRKHPEGDRMTDVMWRLHNKRRVYLRIMRRHLRLFGWKRYAHYLAHHVKETIKESADRSRSSGAPAL
jgi:glycosyltransferase involved in cell wall biosynthesis